MSRIAVDLDDTLTQGEKRYWEGRCDPDDYVIKSINQLYKQGHTIVIWTARPWSNASQVASWLVEHGVRYHGLRMNKGSADVYVDDKALNVNKARDDTGGLRQQIKEMIR